MAVIAEFTLSAGDFDLGRILPLDTGERIVLETVVPLGDTFVHFFWIHGGHATFAADIRSNPLVKDLRLVQSKNGKELYALDWPASEDVLLESILATDGRILNATGGTDAWGFEVRFPDHEDLTAFGEACTDAGIDFTLDRIYNPTKPDAGPFYGLTPAQREAVALAVRNGYYDIPRGTSTAELAAELDISAQAVTERLRRGLATLVKNTLLVEAAAD
jgi:predicted DNA binding protein